MPELNDMQKRRMEALLGGDFKDFSPINYDKITESEISVNLEESQETTFVDALSKMYEMFDSFTLNESDSEAISEADINEELYQIIEALDSIKEKALNEDAGSLLAIAVPGLVALTSFIGAWAKSGGELKLPTKIANTLHDVGQYITKGNIKDRRKAVEAAIKRGNPDIDQRRLDFLVDKAIEDANKRDSKPVPKNSAKHGTYKTGFAAEMNKKGFGLQ